MEEIEAYEAGKKSSLASRRWVLDYAGSWAILLGLSVGLWVGLGWVLPLLWPESLAFQLGHKALLLYGLAALAAHAFLFRSLPIATPRVGPRGASGEASGEACAKCGRAKPADSRHCGLCGECVAGHDHHCFFLARCVGTANQRHFVGFLGWLSFGLAYSAGLLLVFLGREEWGEGKLRLRHLLWPLAQAEFCFGDVTGSQILLLSLLNVASLGAVVSGWMLAEQLFFLRTGQRWRKTSKESPLNAVIKPQENSLRLALGPKPLLTALAPFALSYAMLNDAIEKKR